MATATASKKTTKKTTASKAKQSAKSTAKKSTTKNADTADRVLEQLQSGGQNAIGAVRRFIDSTDESLRGGKSEPTFVHGIVDSALDMSDKLVEVGGDTLRNIVKNVSR